MGLHPDAPALPVGIQVAGGHRPGVPGRRQAGQRRRAAGDEGGRGRPGRARPDRRRQHPILARIAPGHGRRCPRAPLAPPRTRHPAPPARARRPRSRRRAEPRPSAPRSSPRAGTGPGLGCTQSSLPTWAGRREPRAPRPARPCATRRARAAAGARGRAPGDPVRVVGRRDAAHGRGVLVALSSRRRSPRRRICSP